jgi:hypothetical protein
VLGGGVSKKGWQAEADEMASGFHCTVCERSLLQEFTLKGERITKGSVVAQWEKAIA